MKTPFASHGIPAAREILRTGKKKIAGATHPITHYDRQTAERFIEHAEKTGGLIPGSREDMEKIFGRHGIVNTNGNYDSATHWTFSGSYVWPYLGWLFGPVQKETQPQ